MRMSTVGDLVLAVVLAALGFLSVAAEIGAEQVRTGAPPAGDSVVGMALAAAAGLALAVRRRWPLPTLAAVTLLIAGYLLLGYPFGLVFLPFAVAMYTVARHRSLTVAGIAAVAAFAVLLTHLLFSDEGTLGLAWGSAWVAVPLGIGATVRARQEVAARARADLIRAHVDQERLRVAQEVHDIVGHGLAAIKMQADVALHVLAKKPEQAQTALDAISRTSAQALDELRATLAAVREPAGDAGRSPTPSVTRLDELRRRMGEAGLQVKLRVTGQPRELPPAVDLTGYRIVQESLTNVLRHSAATEVTVEIRYEEDALVVSAVNPITGEVRHPGDGSGIAGMRQRVVDLGGTFSAGPVDGRFEVTAKIPTGGRE
ncbi:MAG TPA: sensor histidine kinase [Natronosporangium sp.]